MASPPASLSDVRIQSASVIENEALCREHYKLSLRVDEFPQASPGQFVHLCPTRRTADHYRLWTSDDLGARDRTASVALPTLRRAFSIAGLRRESNGVEIDVIYRVVGRATRWMRTLHGGDALELLGPLGNRFPIAEGKSQAWLVAGGVGLPPMLWLAEALRCAGKRAIAFCGSQTANLLALTLDPDTPPDTEAKRATPTVGAFARHATPVVLSTDDGSLGFAGHIGAAVDAFATANPPDARDLVVYTCGPERMMRFVADFCAARSIECHVCAERAMACGTGMCQSCVVPIHVEDDPTGWQYRLCCTDGPIFDARHIIWDPQ